MAFANIKRFVYSIKLLQRQNLPIQMECDWREMRAEDTHVIWWMFWCLKSGIKDEINSLVRLISSIQNVFQPADSHRIKAFKLSAVCNNCASRESFYFYLKENRKVSSFTHYMHKNSKSPYDYNFFREQEKEQHRQQQDSSSSNNVELFPKMNVWHLFSCRICEISTHCECVRIIRLNIYVWETETQLSNIRNHGTASMFAGIFNKWFSASAKAFILMYISFLPYL